MKRLFHFILSHSIFIALCASALSLQTLQLLSLPYNGYLLAFIFFVTISGYNAYWIICKFSFNQPHHLFTFLQKKRSSLYVMVAGVIGTLYCITKLYLVMYNIIFAAVLLGLYALPVMPFKQFHFTRKVGFLKTIILAFTWAVVTTLVPLQISMLAMGRMATLIFINRFLFMLMLCIIFDRRDIAVDKIRGLQSLATGINPILLHVVMGFIFILYSLVSYEMLENLGNIKIIAALILTGLIAMFFYIGSLKKRSYFFYYFFVDGLMLLSALLTGLARGKW